MCTVRARVDRDVEEIVAEAFNEVIMRLKGLLRCSRRKGQVVLRTMQSKALALTSSFPMRLRKM